VLRAHLGWKRLKPLQQWLIQIPIQSLSQSHSRHIFGLLTMHKNRNSHQSFPIDLVPLALLLRKIKVMIDPKFPLKHDQFSKKKNNNKIKLKRQSNIAYHHILFMA
jgi:hypothetical protein